MILKHTRLKRSPKTSTGSRGGSLLRFSAAFGIFFAAAAAAAAANEYPLIVRVQISGEKTSDDFIEIYNPSDSDIFLGNYQGGYLRLVKRTASSAKDYSIKSWSKDAGAKIPAKGFFLWASSKDESFPEKIGADAKTSQTIAENNGVALRAGPENTGEIIDGVGWGEFNNLLFEGAAFFENPGAGRILSRKENGGFFQDTNNNKDDFYLKGGEIEETILESAAPSEDDAGTKQDTAAPPANESAGNQKEPENYPTDVVFSEIMAAPAGPDETEEWIEFFNKNNFDVDLSGWQVKDAAGAAKNYVFPKNTEIRARSYFVLKRPDSKITLNNDGDELTLIKPDRTVADKIAFGKGPLNGSFILAESGWLWSALATPGEKNIAQTPDDKENGRTTNEFPASTADKSLASIEKSLGTGKNTTRPTTLFAALLVAGFSSAAILFLKKKIVKQN